MYFLGLALHTDRTGPQLGAKANYFGELSGACDQPQAGQFVTIGSGRDAAGLAGEYHWPIEYGL